MARRRLLKSYFQVVYGDKKYSKDETVQVPSFDKTGGNATFIVHSSKAWEIGEGYEWFKFNPINGRKGDTVVTITAPANKTTSPKNTTAYVGLQCFFDIRKIGLNLQQDAGVTPSLKIEGNSEHTANIGSAATSMTFTLSWAYLKESTINYYYLPNEQGNFTNVTVTPSNNRLAVSLSANEDTSNTKTSIVHVSGESIYGETLVATLTIVQAEAEEPVPTYSVTFICKNCSTNQSITAGTLEYKINDGNWTSVTGTKTGFTITVNENDIVNYRGTKSGYLDTNGSETITASGNYNICFVERISNPTFEITAVTYTVVRPHPDAPADVYVHNRWMDEEQMFGSLATTTRAALIALSRSKWAEEDNWSWDEEPPEPQAPEIHFVTNIPLEQITDVGQYISGYTENHGWLGETGTGGSLDGRAVYNASESTNQYSSYTYTLELNPEYPDYNSRNLNVGILKFFYGSTLLESIPIVSETSERDWLRLYSGQTIASGRSNELSAYTINAATGYCDVWITCSKHSYFNQIKDSLEFSPLRFYNGDGSEEIFELLPTFISGVNGSIQFKSSTNNRYHFKIRYPNNRSLSDHRSYGVCIKTAWYTGLDLNWNDHGEIYIDQNHNNIYYTDYYISACSLTYGGTGYGQTSITIPANSITYHRQSEPAITVVADVRCHKWDDAQTENNPSYAYTEYIVLSGSGQAVDTDKLNIELPTWLSQANNTGGTLYDYTPVAGAPWTLNARANQGYDTGNSRTGNVTVKLGYSAAAYAKAGADSAKTISVTQLYGQLERENPVYIYSISGTTQTGKPTQTSINFRSGGASISMQLSGVSGTSLMFGNYMGDSTINQNLSIQIGSTIISTSDATYTFTSNQLVDLRITDKNNSSNYNVNVMISVTTAPTDYSNTPIYINIIRS